MCQRIYSHLSWMEFIVLLANIVCIANVNKVCQAD